jgi:hypothetical protein
MPEANKHLIQQFIGGTDKDAQYMGKRGAVLLGVRDEELGRDSVSNREVTCYTIGSSWTSTMLCYHLPNLRRHKSIIRELQQLDRTRNGNLDGDLTNAVLGVDEGICPCWHGIE